VQTLGVALDHLRGTLLAACGLSIVSCTATTSTTPNPTDEQQGEPIVQPELEPERQPATPSRCADPKAVLQAERDTGFVQCSDGAINRAQALACPNPINAPACKGTEDSRACQSNADCTDAPNGFCKSAQGQMGSFCSCIYPCMSDAECGPNEACMCPDVDRGRLDAARCAPAECKVDADCSSGECGASYYFNGCELELSMRCRAPTDKCHGTTGCDDFRDCVAVQREGALTPFECTPQSCVIGRPLTVDDGVRVASVEDRAWGRTRLEGLAPERARAQYWLGIARMEHASVASFARFTQELLRFGAPPDLLTDALAAAADEVQHAEQTFALASAYAHEPLGPGALRIDDLQPTSDLEVFVTRLITEGCVGETLGVAEALALLECELDPLLRPSLEQIAADETRHAALAWRTLKWIATRVDSTIIDRAFERALAAAEHVDDEDRDPAHGRLGTHAKHRVRTDAIASVIMPLARAWQSQLS
jgi:hypothetical protein